MIRQEVAETVDTLPNSSEGRPQRKNVGVRLIHLFGMTALFGTAVSFGAGQHWIADVASQFRIQYVLVLVPAVGVWISQRSRKFVRVGGFAFVVNLWPVVPYFVPPGPSPAALAPTGTQTPFRLLVMNVMRTNENFPATLQQVVQTNADFVFLMEVEPAWQDPLRQLRDKYPHQKLLCRQDYTGVAFLSKFKWEDIDLVDIEDIANPPLDIRFPSTNDRVAGFRLIATHPLPPFGSRLTDSRDRQLNVLAQRFRSDKPNLLFGDFNLTPWSPRFKQVLAEGQLRDASLGYGIAPTLTPLPTWMGGLKVDHVLVNDRVNVRNYRLEYSEHSDHRVVIVDFDLVSQ